MNTFVVLPTCPEHGSGLGAMVEVVPPGEEVSILNLFNGAEGGVDAEELFIMMSSGLTVLHNSN